MERVLPEELFEFIPRLRLSRGRALNALHLRIQCQFNGLRIAASETPQGFKKLYVHHPSN